jgi:hypothetical protein
MFALRAGSGKALPKLRRESGSGLQKSLRTSESQLLKRNTGNLERPDRGASPNRGLMADADSLQLRGYR